MPRNIEIKAHVASVEALVPKAAAIADEDQSWSFKTTRSSRAKPEDWSFAAAAAGEPGFPNGTEVDNLIYAVILFSIATTAVLVFVFEKTQLHRVLAGWWFRHH
jgi:hypothetical protein